MVTLDLKGMVVTAELSEAHLGGRRGWRVGASSSLCNVEAKGLEIDGELAPPLCP